MNFPKNTNVAQLLLALLGFTGDLIIDEREQRKTLLASLSIPIHLSLMNVPSNSLLTSPSSNPAKGILFAPADLVSELILISSDSDSAPCWDLIERLIKLGFYYRELDRFAKKSGNLSWIRSVASVHPLEQADELSKQSREKKPSVYRRAISNGIGEILSVY